MSKNTKKMAVLEMLQKHNAFIQLPDLLTQLGSDFAQRSVRRWLDEWVAEQKVEKTGQKRATQYRAIAEEKMSFGANAYAAVAQVKKPLMQRRPVSYNTHWIDNYQPNHTFYLTQEQRNTLKTVGKPESNAIVAGTYARKIYDHLLIDLSYNSSRLEGNTYTLGETEKLIMEGIEGIGKLDVEKVMILNHKDAIRYLVDNATHLIINNETVCTIHYLLSEGLVLSKYAGKMRDHSVRIGQSTYIPIDQSTRLEKQLMHICSIANNIEDPHEQSFFLLAHIAYLQAFTDVNKRTARLSANIPLIKNNLYPISFSKIDKDDYISAMLAIYELNDVSALAELYTFSSLYTAKEYDVLMHTIDFKEVHVYFRKELRALLREIILKKLTGKKMINYIARTVKKNIPVEFRTACIHSINEDLKYMGPERLVGLGVSKQDLEAWRLL